MSRVETLQQVETLLRDQKILVAKDVLRNLIWMFQGTTDGATKGQQLADSTPKVEGFNLTAQVRGELKAADLLKTPGKSTHTSNTSANPSNAAAYMRNVQSTNTRTPVANSQLTVSSGTEIQKADLFTVYELFLSSIVALLSIQLIRDAHLIPLNYRTFLSVDELSDINEDSPIPQSLTAVVSIDVQWTSGGSIIFSWSYCDYMGLQSLDKAQDNPDASARSYLRIAPCGVIARVASDHSVSKPGSITDRERRKRAKIRLASEKNHEWKLAAQRWLVRLGINLPDLQDDSNWTTIELSRDFGISDGSPGTDTNFSGIRQILWPSALCFSYDPPTSEGRQPGPTGVPPTPVSESNVTFSEDHDPGLRWFQTDDFDGYEDPLDKAEQWLNEKPGRDVTKNLGRQGKGSEQGPLVAAAGDDMALNASSPLYLRAGVYADLQPVSGVYPTPPDGILSQGISTGFIAEPQPTVSGIHASEPAHPHGQVAVHASPVATVPPVHNTKQLPPPAPVSVKEGSNDDLFEDMDEDVFGGNDITDADFNFFDEPDDTDMDGVSVAPISQAMKTEPSSENAASLQQARDDHSVPLESPPVSALTAMTREIEEVLAGDEKSQETSAQFSVHFAASPEHLRNNSDTPAILGYEDDQQDTPSKARTKIIKVEPSTSPPCLSAAGVQDSSATGRRESVFDPVSFSQNMSLTDAKYSGGGRFSFSFRQKHSKDSASPEITLKNTTSSRYSAKLPSHLLKSPPNDTRQLVTPAHRQNHMSNGIYDDDDASDTYSESYDDSESDSDLDTGLEEAVPESVPPSKRKFAVDDHSTPVSITSYGEGSQFEETKDIQPELLPILTDPKLLSSFQPSPWDWSLVDFAIPYSLADALPIVRILPTSGKMESSAVRSEVKEVLFDDVINLSTKDAVNIAQIFSEQVLTSNLDLLPDEADVLADPFFPPQSIRRQSAGSLIRSVTKQFFPNARDCTLLNYAAIQDATLDNQAAKAQQRAAPRRTNSGTGNTGEGPGATANPIFPLAPPNVRVRRGEVLWDLLPPALNFWEPMGFAPVSDPKNVMAFCVYPFSNSIAPAMDTFMENIGLAYESCKLGSHIRGRLAGEDIDDGLFSCHVTESTSWKAAMRSFRDNCIQLGEALASQDDEEMFQLSESKVDTFVIYMINPFDSPKGLWHMCAAFWAMFQAYGQGPDPEYNEGRNYDLVLQVVPMKYIASFDRPVVMNPLVTVQLAREIYDRCPPSKPSDDLTPLSIYRAPSIQLEETLPRNIQFKLVPEPPSDLMRESSYMHVGYAMSLDSSWLTAAWTDNFGKYQSSVSYRLTGRNFYEVSREIWQTTIEIIQARKVSWRLCIAKAGIMEKDEIEGMSARLLSYAKLHTY